jgi:putative hydrolase of the HAD superfamily
MTKYKQIIFDVGGVLIEWKPHTFPADVKGVFQTALWGAHDAGVLSRLEVIEKLPETYDREKFRQFVNNLHRYLGVVPEMVELFHHIKKQGLRTYILSNMSREMYRELYAMHDFFHHADGQIISAHVGTIKPFAAIYETLLTTYGLEKEECLFIDDLEENVAAAQRIGIDGVVCKNPADTKAEILRRLQLV